MKRIPEKRRISFLVAQSGEIGAAEFKAHCLEIMDEVERLGVEITITKHRKPVARLIPAAAKRSAFCGSLKGVVLEEHDIVSPIDVAWNADAARRP